MLGLTPENIKRLVAGEPIRINTDSHGPHIPRDVSIGIVYGPTVEAIATSLKKDGLANESVEIRRGPVAVAVRRAHEVFPDGKLNDLDEGQLAVAMQADHTSRTVVINFGKPIQWLGLGKQDALSWAEELTRLANRLP